MKLKTKKGLSMIVSLLIVYIIVAVLAPVVGYGCCAIVFMIENAHYAARKLG